MLWQLPATQLAELIRTRQVSARDAVQAALDRMDDVNGAINAVVDYFPAEALAAADVIDARFRDGEEVGTLAGVPVTVKVNVDQAGHATTEGAVLQRDLIAETNNPVVDNLLKAGAVIIGRTNAPTFCLRWFTDNRLYGQTRNPRDPRLTPGGSSGGAAAAVTVGIGAIAHGTDIAGSIRYPAYACGVHGLRPTLGRVPAFNASLPERTIGGQIGAVSGPLARTVADLRLALTAMAARDVRDPWWVPVPLTGPPEVKRAAICVVPDGLDTDPDVAQAVRDAGARLEAAGWHVDELATTPPLAEAAAAQAQLVFVDRYANLVERAEREGDAGALNVLAHQRATAAAFDQAEFSRVLSRRAAILRQWLMFLETYAVVVIPVSAELPFETNLDMQGDAAFERVWRAQMPQLGLPFLGLPVLTVSTGLLGTTPVGVQIVSARYREDLCLAAGEAIEAAGAPPSPVDPVAASVTATSR
ncbi:MAG: amidase [Mycobacterium sp.]|jgi:amidase|nr:amidase [Mycobacterium sp.]